MKNLLLKRGKEESLLRFHPWVFSGAIQTADEGLDDGDLVRVLNFEGRFVAVGHYQKGSIAVRVLSFRDVLINDEFWFARLSSALNMRLAIGLADNPDNNTYRLVHGEGDNLPGLVIDIYGHTAVMQAHSLGMHRSRVSIAEQLMKVMQGRIENIYYKSETTLPFMDEMENGFIIGGGGNNTAVENALSTSARTVCCLKSMRRIRMYSICSAIPVVSRFMPCVVEQNLFILLIAVRRLLN